MSAEKLSKPNMAYKKLRLMRSKMMASDSVSDIEIPIWVKGTQKWVTGLTKRTTCDDVIYALLYQDGLHEHVNTSAYAIFEKWREVERPLQGRTKIVKIWRTWGADQTNVHLSMRKFSELEYSGEFSLTRRKKKSRHKTRERDREREKERKSREHRHHHGYCQNSSERLRSMETLVKLVISQERKLSDMIEHADDTDKLIDKYESRLHKHRLKNNGGEYTKDVYLDENADAIDEMFSNANIEELELYVNFCDQIIALEDRIQSEHAKIEELAYQIQICSYDRDSLSGPSSLAEETSQIQVDLTRAQSCAIMQHYKYQDLQREIQFYEDKLAHKDDLCKRLQRELDDLDNDTNVHVRSSDSVNSGSSNGSAGSSNSNQLPLPERSKRVNVLTNTAGSPPPPLPERIRPTKNSLKPKLTSHSNPIESPHLPEVQGIHRSLQNCQTNQPERKPILKTTHPELRNGYNTQIKQNNSSETKVRFKTDDLLDKYFWDESSSEGISIDQSDCSDSKDVLDYIRRDDYSQFKPGVADRPYLTVKVEDQDSNSDTGLSSMHSDDSAVYHLETLV
ncbi:ras association domain-containing protein 9-like isoform X2 [Dreissena polymorpha]|uniref:ras association domain-containing protein 9-like isoform X2 n=1 Tax=Dreissena polymorpha TaxID=45954 RepID=UPI00226444C3|nr:ras association domain-containing protein 9-like isoform X2 [Dreissena polymorpha]